MTPSWSAKVDANQPEIVEDLRELGHSVLLLHRLGQGAPDILVGIFCPYCQPGHNILLEIKDGSKPPSARTLTRPEADFHKAWKGPLGLATSTQDALDHIQAQIDACASR